MSVKIPDLRQRRTEKGWSQKQLADLVGCSAGMIGNVEVGRFEASEELARKIDTALTVGKLPDPPKEAKSTVRKCEVCGKDYELRKGPGQWKRRTCDDPACKAKLSVARAYKSQGKKAPAESPAPVPAREKEPKIWKPEVRPEPKPDPGILKALEALRKELASIAGRVDRLELHYATKGNNGQYFWPGQDGFSPESFVQGPVTDRHIPPTPKAAA